jgi:hypothetical protein
MNLHPWMPEQKGAPTPAWYKAAGFAESATGGVRAPPGGKTRVQGARTDRSRTAHRAPGRRTPAHPLPAFLRRRTDSGRVVPTRAPTLRRGAGRERCEPGSTSNGRVLGTTPGNKSRPAKKGMQRLGSRATTCCATCHFPSSARARLSRVL